MTQTSPRFSLTAREAHLASLTVQERDERNDGSLVRLPRPATGSGTYRYRLNGNDTEVTETFEVSGDATSVFSERRAPGGTMLVANVEADDLVNARCHLTFRSDALEPVIAEYRLEAGRLTARQSSGVTTEEALDVHGILSPLLRVFQGPAIAAVIRTGGECPVVIPALDPSAPDELLSPTVQLRRAERLGTEVGDDGATPLRHCRYLGGNYDDTAEFWLDDHDRLVRYRFPQGPDQLWEVDLVSGPPS